MHELPSILICWSMVLCVDLAVWYIIWRIVRDKK